MQKKRFSRREFLALAGATGGAALLAACQSETVEVTREVEKIVKETVVEKETVMVEGETVEVTKVVEVEKVVTAVPEPELLTLVVHCYVPSEHIERSAENPTVTNAPRILAEAFKDHYPYVEIEWLRGPPAPEGVSGDTHAGSVWAAWHAAGDLPDVCSPGHEIPIQNGWCLPIDEFLALPNQFAPQYATWKEVFHPNLMASLVFGDGKTYCAPVMHPYPGVEVGLAYNVDWLNKIGMDPPATWTEQKAVCKALKEAGSGLVPWPPEAKDGNVWPVALQLLVSQLQDECVEMDTNGDFFVGAEEALPAFRAGLVGPLTPDFRTAWLEMFELTRSWVDGWATADVDAMWRDGDIGIRTTGGWEFAAMMSDPLIEFERYMIPPPYVTSADVPGGNDPPSFTAGDGKVPSDLVTAINGPDTAIIKETVERKNSLKEAVAWLHWLTEPVNNGFITNENQTRVPAARDAPLGPLWGEIAKYQLPQHKYQIAWWGQCLYFDNTHFNELRKVFVAWATGQIDDETFFQRQQQETVDGADRYAADLERLKQED